jgi:hypothetical protein
VLAHPGRRDVWTRFTPSWTEQLLGIELWNRKYDGIAPGRSGAKALRDEPGLVPFVGLDFHTARQFHPLAMLVDVEGRPHEASICTALRAHRCRAIAFRLPVLAISHGTAMRALLEVERVRKTVARSVRNGSAQIRGSGRTRPKVRPPRDRS